jgi:DNA-3-methyladenine glycosylase II
MFLMFRLGRPDVLPDGDLGIQKAVQKSYRLRSLPSPERVRKIGKPWSPYSSVASWYLWKLVDTND